MTKPHRSKAQRAELARQAFELKILGRTYHDIGIEIGVPRATVFELVQEEISARVSPKVEQYRELQLAEIDKAIEILWPMAETPAIITQMGKIVYDQNGETIPDTESQMKALDRIQRLIERRAKLLGLDAPAKTDLKVTQQSEQDLEIKQLIEQMNNQNSQQLEQMENNDN
jgi:hypothetical protein